MAAAGAAAGPGLAAITRALLAASRARLVVCNSAAAAGQLLSALLQQQQCQEQQLPWPAQLQQSLPSQGFAAQRCYAKARGGGGGGGGKRHGGGGGGKRKQQQEEDDNDDAGGGDDDDAGDAAPEFDPDAIEQMMQAAVEHLQHELAGVRTGRANPGLIESLQVDAQGERVPLKAVGSVTVRGPQTLAVVLFDPALGGAVEKAVRESPLSLQAAHEGAEVLVRLPRMTADAVAKLTKLVGMEAERAHQSVRRARQKGMDSVKKLLKSAAADERKRAEKEVQRLHDAYSAEVERLRKIKAAELQEHH